MTAQKRRFAICVDNRAYEASLIVRKIYEIIPDKAGAADDLVRIVDESGEDYLYHQSHFIVVEFPVTVEHALLAAQFLALIIVSATVVARASRSGGCWTRPGRSGYTRARLPE